MQERKCGLSGSVVVKSESKSVSKSIQLDSESKSDTSTYTLHASVNEQPPGTPSYKIDKDCNKHIYQDI